MTYKEKVSPIIGRKKEQRILQAIFQSKKAELLAVYGRRRVGKTFLLTTFFKQKDCIFFYCSGLQNGKLKEQLDTFSQQIGDTFYNGVSIKLEASWMHAFEILTKAIGALPKNKKIVLFFDELPWMVTKRSKFLQSFDYYWNRYWTHNNQLKLVVCGSSASWIIDNLINNKGGLYNRVTRSMQLEPFSLSETKEFLNHNKIKLKPSQVLELYMILGGIPHYLALVGKGMSANQAIDEICFQKNGELVKEFDRLFSSLFSNGEAYAALVRIIGKHRYGIGQAQLIKESASSRGGSVTARLKNLEEAGFIQEFIPHYHIDKGRYYKVTDEFCLFYLYWIEPNLQTIAKQIRSSGYWLSKSQSTEWKSWSGYAFEAVCYKHIPEIRKALHIGVEAEIGNWRYAPKSTDQVGCQIDLLFDRADGSMTLCEIKYNAKPFVIDKAYSNSLKNKMKVYQKVSRTNKQIFMAMITVNGLKETLYSEELICGVVTLDDFFEKI